MLKKPTIKKVVLLLSWTANVARKYKAWLVYFCNYELVNIKVNMVCFEEKKIKNTDQTYRLNASKDFSFNLNVPENIAEVKSLFYENLYWFYYAINCQRYIGDCNILRPCSSDSYNRFFFFCLIKSYWNSKKWSLTTNFKQQRSINSHCCIIQASKLYGIGSS